MPKKTRIQKYKDCYGPNGRAVLSSIASVGRAGRTRNPARIAAARAAHYALMATV